VRSRRGCQNHRRREPSPEKASAANIQPARACLLGTTPRRPERPLCARPPLLPSPPLSSPPFSSPPPSAALPLAHGGHAVAGRRCLIRKQNYWVSATRASTTNASIVQPLPIILCQRSGSIN
jgi:hypothetical protein